MYIYMKRCFEKNLSEAGEERGRERLLLLLRLGFRV